MARVRLSVHEPTNMDEGIAIDANGAVIRIPFLRLLATVRIGAGVPVLLRDCVLDTAAPLSIFPEAEWRLFESEIEWLRPSPTRPFPTWLTTPTGFAGGSYKCRLGTVSVTVIGQERGAKTLPSVRLVAQFLEDGLRPQDSHIVKRILLGLHYSILQGRQLFLDEDRRQTWLKER